MNGPKWKLLIVEDEATILNGMANYIRRNSLTIDDVLTAKNGQEALDILFRFKPQVMLLDIGLPVKSGIDVMREAKAAGALPCTVILSGHDEFRYAQQAMRFGAVDYLLKPSRSSEILETVEGLFAKLLGEKASGQTKKAPDIAAGSPLIQAALRFIDENYATEISLPAVAEALGVTPSYLSTLFKRTLGYGFSEHLNRVRIDRACDYFIDRKIRTYEVAYKVGFIDEKYFSSVFRKVKGMTPSAYRKSLPPP